MFRIRTKVWSHISLDSDEGSYVKDVMDSEPKDVHSYRELVSLVAKITYQNPEMGLLYRGQDQDYMDSGGNSSLYPAIYRTPEGDRHLGKEELNKRFRVLKKAEREVEKIDIEGSRKVGKFKELRWALIQHYNIHCTPLLDVTHSLRVASSFAVDEEDDTGLLFVFGIPYSNSSISYFTDKEIVSMRLLSVCPPDALRPHFQEGYLVGTFPLEGNERKDRRFNFANRLVAKFKLHNQNGQFWNHKFNPIPKEALMPEDNDDFKWKAKDIKKKIGSECT